LLATDKDDHLAILFTDVEGSTRRWENEKEKMAGSLARHDQIVRNIIGSAGGLVFSIAGDSFGAIFSASTDALGAALRIQAEIQAEDWSDGVEIKVRMSLHCGPVIQRDNGAYGPEIVRAAILCGKLPDHEVEYLGRYRLRKISEPQHVYQSGTESFAKLRNVTTKVCTVPAIRDALIGRQEQAASLINLMDNVTDAEDITSAVARGLDLTLLNDVAAVTQLLDYFDDRRCLLLFDNCEHLLHDTAVLIDVLLARCATLKIIATSREVLDVDGESVWRVPSLPVSTDATELFLRTANKRAGVTFDTPLNRKAVEEICQLLDGLPLAIELAAARTRMLSIKQIGDMLRDQFRTLELQGRRRKRRSETLGDVVQWSHDLLDDDERMAFRRLAIFNGGFNLRDAPFIMDCEETAAWDLVDSLVAKSLIDTRSDTDGSLRFSMLNTIRAYGAEQLQICDELHATATRHCNHFVELAERARHPYLPDPKTAVLHRAELLNLRAAASWALAGDNKYLLLPVAICLASLSDIVTSPATALQRVEDAYHIAAEAPQPHFNKAFLDIHAALFDLFNGRPQQLLDRLQGYSGGMVNYGRTRACLDLGNSEAAKQIIDKAAEDPADAWLHFNDLAQVLWLIDAGDVESAAGVLINAARRDSGLRRWQDGDFLVHFAAMHMAVRNTDRAAHLIDNCRSRHGLISTTALKIKQQLWQCPPQYDSPESLKWLATQYAVESTERILALQPDLLAEELAYWGKKTMQKSSDVGENGWC